jgi:UDPglucose 6-dehydrogenase
MLQQKNLKIGFIGQGWIGRNYADNFEERGYRVIRYGLEDEYRDNKDSISECDIVFIAVPTPTTTNGFDDSFVREVVKLVGPQKIAVIKSTIIPGTTEKIQAENKNIFIMHSPEFLAEKTARNDAAHPSRNIIGIPIMNNIYKEKAELVLSILPASAFNSIIDSKSAEFIKYVSNSFLASKVVFFNIAYDLAEKLGVNFEYIRSGVVADPRIGESHSKVIDASGHNQNKPGRGAGGHCFIKDFEAYLATYKDALGEDQGYKTLLEIRNKNIELLRTSGKDLDLLKAIFNE